MKYTKVLAAVGIIALMTVVSILASMNVTLASEPEEQDTGKTAAQAHEREREHDKVYSSTRNNDSDGDYYRRVKHNIERDIEDEEEDDEESSGTEDYESSYAGSIPTPPVTPSPVPAPSPAPANNATLVSYSGFIQPLLNQRCNNCHPKGGVNLSSYAGTRASVNILPGMGQGYLNAAELQKLRTWIQQGALNN